ncbi:MAG: GntR family transcriptional regulator [Oscillospiraceae bacterium]|nr:GntR family transcriptional regulator [Oscillospiraceae bacterium]
MDEKTLRPDLSDGKYPLYRQIVDSILSEIEEGLLKPNNRLPTVRELAEEMKFSTGTVKHAYDELERLGAIEKARGRGTFVRNRGVKDKQGKKEQAIWLVDNLINDMQKLGFSLRDTQVLFDQRTQKWEDKPLRVRVIVVDCNPETLHVISEQVARIRNTDVSHQLLDDLPHDFDLVEESPDIIVTTPTHFERVVLAAREGHISKVVLSPSRDTVAKLAKVGENRRVGILAASERFALLIRETLAELTSNGGDTPHILFGQDGVEAFMRSMDTLIVPNHCARFCAPREANALRVFQQEGGEAIEFIYHIDAGSLMYLEQQISRVVINKSKSINRLSHRREVS